jgi:hypothetical protein
MCSCNQSRTDTASQRQRAVARTHAICGALSVAIAAALGGLLFYLRSPTDIERAEADLKKAWVVVNTLDEEAAEAGKNARGHAKRAAEYRQTAADEKDSTDTPRQEWIESNASGHKKLSKANWDRRDNALHLAAEYRRLVAEADCEILRAKDARDRGTPYKVAPRVREILTPVLAGQ